MKITDQAEAAIALLQRPFGWTKGRFARDEHGDNVRFDDTRATSFCMVGAIGKVTGTTWSELEEKVRDYKGSVAFNVNDNAESVDEVIAFIKEAVNG